VQQREKEAAAIGGKNFATQIMSSGGSFARIENSRAMGLRRRHIPNEDRKDFKNSI
jgi:hypothetical protein